MTFLVFGQAGQVATELGLHAGAICAGRQDADLTKPGQCAKLIKSTKPEFVINAAAYTAVDKAESEIAIATSTNADAPGEMAIACKALQIPFVHISTDYVFDGTGDGIFQPDDKTGPLNIYGRTKLAGEAKIQDSGAVYAIIRTSWVFSPHGNNFVKTMLRLGQERSSLSIVNDQYGGPTPAAAIANTCLVIAKKLLEHPEKKGVYQYTGYPDTSWDEFAKTIFSKAKLNVAVKGIQTSEYPTAATRPMNSRMDCSTTKQEFGLDRPYWEDALSEIINNQSSAETNDK